MELSKKQYDNFVFVTLRELQKSILKKKLSMKANMEKLAQL